MGYSAESKESGYLLNMTDKQNSLAFNDLVIGFQKRQMILPPLTGRAGKGELIAVIGRNGIGKSTLLRTFAGLQPHLSGNLFVEGSGIASYSRKGLSARVGYISTEIVRVSNMRVYDLVSLGRFPHTNWMGRIDTRDREHIYSALSSTEMTGYSERPLTELSDGERQRAMIAMVLAQDAGIMIMDEPTAFLDITGRYGMIHLLHDLTRQRQKTIVFSTHDLLTAVRLADKIWLLGESGIVEGSPEDLMLTGSFDILFDVSKVRFDPVTGNVSFMTSEKGQVNVLGDGAGRYWTEHAFIRAGFCITDKPSAIEVSVMSTPEMHWICRSAEGISGFDSVYDLMQWIREKPFISSDNSCSSL
jgi:iron complex transport system ATP-binding protein